MALKKHPKHIFVTKGKHQSCKEITHNHEEINQLEDDVRVMQSFHPRTGDVHLYHNYSNYDGSNEDNFFKSINDDYVPPHTAAAPIPPPTTILVPVTPSVPSTMIVQVPVGKWIDREDNSLDPDDLDLLTEIMQIPPEAWVNSLRASVNKAIQDGKWSILHPRLKHQPLPFWILALWEKACVVHEAQTLWINADKWLQVKILENGTLSSTECDINFSVTRQDMFLLPQRKRLIGRRNTSHFARILSDDSLLLDTLMDMMVQFTAYTELPDAIHLGKMNFDSLPSVLERMLAQGKLLFFPGDSLNLRAGQFKSFIQKLQQWLTACFNGPFKDQGNTLPHTIQQDSVSCRLFALNTITHNVFGDPLSILNPASTQALWFKQITRPYIHKPPQQSTTTSTSMVATPPPLSTPSDSLQTGQTEGDDEKKERWWQLIKRSKDKADSWAAEVAHLKKEKETQERSEIERQKEVEWLEEIERQKELARERLEPERLECECLGCKHLERELLECKHLEHEHLEHERLESSNPITMIGLRITVDFPHLLELKGITDRLPVTTALSREVVVHLHLVVAQQLTGADSIRDMLCLPFTCRFCGMSGLLWQLAIQYGPDNLISAALSGPSSDAYMHLNSELIGTDIDDMVKDAHIKMLLGITIDGHSLWPPIDVFEKHMQWEEEWTAILEMWFMKHIAMIQNRVTHAFTTHSQWSSRLWQHTLTSSKDTMKVVTEVQAQLLCYNIDQLDLKSFVVLD
ncbi:uncharacterized protein F5147DRAFT_652010 [Suillus discolor]|uniref:Uncharacterized protein n=1 Tax=Suillus discolor TaxID=1912936 RepID=A0A9P7FAQ1_9AGAM|nr:uncharacterized protein F5147DRAFT_652010 [Suillus discolor]KAG2110401.1 hypothetical protein F5147DRAFT_652010 [Suillus discolor]